MFDYGERDVPCGTLPNGQTVPLTGRNASILRPRAKRAEGATTPLSPDINQVCAKLCRIITGEYKSFII